MAGMAQLRLSRFKFAEPPTPRDTEASNAYAIIHDSLGPVCICRLIGINSTDQDIWDEARRIIARYRAADEVDGYVARWKTEPRVLITVTPEHIATRVPR